ncbi:MAG: hypothetical protein OHK0053_21930 [Microscillaceae bacterium]
MNKKIALITGASSGIGGATAEVLAQQGFRLILCGRRAERLEALAHKLLPLSETKTLVFDVRDREALNQAWASLPEAWQSVHVLINNAGNAHGLDFIQEGQVEDWEAMLDINVKGLLYVSQVVIPQMVARQEGHILNIGSLAGKEVYPKGNVYCASKHAVDALTQGMRMDLYKHGIRVSAINPGLVATEFSEVRFKGDAERAKKVYEGYAPLLAQDIAEVIAFVVSRPAHVNIADLLVLPTAQAASYLVNRGE